MTVYPITRGGLLLKEILLLMKTLILIAFLLYAKNGFRMFYGVENLKKPRACLD